VRRNRCPIVFLLPGTSFFGGFACILQAQISCGMHYELPYPFVLNMLYPVRPSIKKVLGCYGLYMGNRLLLLLRDKETSPEYNGVLVGTTPEFYPELQQELHKSFMDIDLDGSHNSWIFISEDLPDFEAKVQKACALIKAQDQRIGRIL
jgi:hypothetical protein